MSLDNAAYRAIPIFESDLKDWPIWKIKLRAYLDGKDLLYIVDREIDVPLPGDSKEEIAIKATQASSRTKDDKKVKSMLFGKLNNSVILLVASLATAFEMFEKLERQYESSSMQSILLRLDKLLELQYRGNNMGSHILLLTGMINFMKTTGSLDWDMMFIVILLRSLPKSQDWNGFTIALKTQDAKSLTIDKQCVKPLPNGHTS